MRLVFTRFFRQVLPLLFGVHLMKIRTVLTVASAAALVSGSALAFPRIANDFDGDGRADVAVYHADSGFWYISLSSNGSLWQPSWGWAEARPVLGHFDGDVQADLAVYNQQSGAWYIRQSTDGQLRSLTFDISDGRAVPGDYDGDAITDIAVYQRKSGDWFILKSSNGQTLQQNFGWSAARPVSADYDGDGATDLAVYDRATGNWYILNSGNGVVEVINFGWNQARPVPADYDGDGRADLAVYHLATGNWYIRSSINGAVSQVNWGWIEGRPVPSDYDGDGITDLAVYNQKTGNWYIRQSGNSGALLVRFWGWPDAAAIPSYRDGGIQGPIILAFGDSITYGTSSSSGSPLTGYPILLEHKAEPALGGHCISINGGNPGESTADGVKRIGIWLSLFHPDLTLIMEGTNDEYFKVPYSTTQANLSSMVAQALASGSSAIIGTVPPVIKSATRDRTEQEKLIEGFNPRIYSIAATFSIRVAQVWESITAVPGWETKLMDQETANHPNDAGYKVVRDAFFAPLKDGTLDGDYY
jgi:lysophospholipase L1-like esterase